MKTHFSFCGAPLLMSSYTNLKTGYAYETKGCTRCDKSLGFVYRWHFTIIYTSYIKLVPSTPSKLISVLGNLRNKGRPWWFPSRSGARTNTTLSCSLTPTKFSKNLEEHSILIMYLEIPCRKTTCKPALPSTDAYNIRHNVQLAKISKTNDGDDDKKTS